MFSTRGAFLADIPTVTAYAEYPSGAAAWFAISQASNSSPTSSRVYPLGIAPTNYDIQASLKAQLCGGEDIIMVGAGNSAGQAAVYLSQTARHVHMLIRSSGLAETMSRYLIRRIEETPSIGPAPAAR